MMDKSGLYAIVNKTNGMFYIGSSCNVPQRIKQHQSFLKRGKAAKQIQADYDMGNVFDFVQLLSLDANREELYKTEEAYIKRFKKTAIYNSTSALRADRGNAFVNVSSRNKWLKDLGDIKVDARTINKLCSVLGCQPGDIMEYVEDSNV